MMLVMMNAMLLLDITNHNCHFCFCIKTTHHTAASTSDDVLSDSAMMMMSYR